MTIFLYGRDLYRARQKLNEIIRSYKEKQKTGLTLKTFDFLKDSYDDFYIDFQTIPIFGGKKMTIIENFLSNQDIKKRLSKDLKKIIDSSDIFIFFEKDSSLKDPLFQALKKGGKSQEFKPLEGAELKKWVAEEFEKLEAEIDPVALHLLVNYIGNNIWSLSEEIKKLAAYKAKDKERIKIEDINLLVRPKTETDIFKTIDAIAGKDKKKALALVRGHIEKGDSPLYVFSMINFQFRNILSVKSRCKELAYLGEKDIGKIAKEIGLHPFIVKKSFLQARNFSLEKLKIIYENIFQKDLAIKTGRITAEVALESLISEI